jgi:N-acetyl-alpha-D-muramate 1-phosphate uridylyltransferase
MLPIALLAGGMATRLGKLTEARAKSLIEIEGRPFIDYQLRAFASAGFERVVICVGNLAEQVKQFVGDGSQYNLKIEYSHDGAEPRGTGGALKQALVILGSDFFVQYGDSFLSIDYVKMESSFFSNSKKCLMSIYKNEGNLDQSNVNFLEEGIVQYSKSHPSPDMNFIDYGCMVIEYESFRKYEAPARFDLSEYLEFLSNQQLLRGFQAQKRFFEIGSLTGIRDFEQYARSNPHEF